VILNNAFLIDVGHYLYILILIHLLLTTKEEQEQFEKERAAFREQLKRDWEED
jgi:hypothetical protein